MQYRSASTLNPDPYRAGIQIGDALRSVDPEVILLFASISYDPDFSEFFSGLQDALEGRSPLIVGGTGDGIFERNLAADYGVCALGMNSGGAVRWSTALRRGVGGDSRSASREAAREAAAGLDGDPAFCFVLADGLQADGTEVVAGLREILAIPFFGGLSGDDRNFTRSRIFHGGREHEDAVVVLLGSGPLPFLLQAASGWTPMGEEGVVEEVAGRRLGRISGRPVRDYISQQIGRVMGATDLGVMPLAVYTDEQQGRFFLRSSAGLDEGDGSTTLFGSLPAGIRVKVCAASREEVLDGVREAVASLKPWPSGFQPGAAVLISCAGRKWYLEDTGRRELEAFQQSLGLDLPLVGIPSFGEIGPFRLADGRTTPPCFHNVTFVLCLLGA
ncbi:MAG: FIST N-terminal domain-containing protein [bacterium]|nr:FIST N-terminal domain-containing protein [bacterium]